jgi:hypothetical protein
MPTRRISSRKRMSVNDVRNRLMQIHGGPPPGPQLARASLRLLERKLRQKVSVELAMRAEAAKIFAAGQRSLMKQLAGDRHFVQAERRLHGLVGRELKRRRRVTPGPHVEPQLGSGSLLTIVAPPYDYEYRFESTTNNNVGVSFAQADRKKGDFGVTSSAHVATAAGMGVSFRPVPRTRARFSPLIKYTSYWMARAQARPAYTEGVIGVYISSIDVAGGDFREEIDTRVVLWQVYGTQPNALLTGGETDLILGPSFQVYFAATNDRRYFVWVWGYTVTDGLPWSNKIGAPQADAAGQLFVNVPFMVFEQ